MSLTHMYVHVRAMYAFINSTHINQLTKIIIIHKELTMTQIEKEQNNGKHNTISTVS